MIILKRIWDKHLVSCDIYAYSAKRDREYYKNKLFYVESVIDVFGEEAKIKWGDGRIESEYRVVIPLSEVL